MVLIIAVLAGLLFPVLASVRRNGSLSVCTSNLRHLGMAYSLYVADYGAYPRPGQLARSRYLAGNKSLLFCPADTTLAPRKAASSYVFRSVVPPEAAPVWGRVDLHPSTVVVSCRHHLDRPSVGHPDGGALGPPRYPYHLVLRASGGVERLADARIRTVPLPGDRPTYTHSYPGEPGYELARR